MLQSIVGLKCSRISHCYCKLIHYIYKTIMQGIIKKIVADKKIGFISQKDVEKDTFFSSEKLDGVKFEDLKEGDTVTFEIEEGAKGPVAVKVKKA